MDLPDQRIKPRSSALQANSLQSEPPGKGFLQLKAVRPRAKGGESYQDKGKEVTG